MELKSKLFNSSYPILLVPFKKKLNRKKVLEYDKEKVRSEKIFLKKLKNLLSKKQIQNIVWQQLTLKEGIQLYKIDA